MKISYKNKSILSISAILGLVFIYSISNDIGHFLQMLLFLFMIYLISSPIAFGLFFTKITRFFFKIIKYFTKRYLNKF